MLINNVKFDCERMKRRGAERDEESMEILLKGLGYEVVKHTDLSGKVGIINTDPQNALLMVQTVHLDGMQLFAHENCQLYG